MITLNFKKVIGKNFESLRNYIKMILERSNSEILIYQNQEGNIKIDVRLQEETVWLTQSQMGQLFGKDIVSTLVGLVIWMSGSVFIPDSDVSMNVRLNQG